MDYEELKLMYRYVPMADLTHLQWRQLRRIWGCADMGEVADLMKNARGAELSQAASSRGSVGFRRFQPAGTGGGNIQTFEWRQMSGSLNADHINQWVKVCVEFTDFCRLSDETQFKEILEYIIERGADFTGIELLEILGADTRIFKDMLEAWAQDPSFCNDRTGSRLFVPK